MIRITRAIDYDVIVVGGGPAGAATAAHLAAAGVSVAVLDRSTFHRDKVCGDFVGPAALVELKALGVTDEPGYARTNKIRDAALHLDGKPLIIRQLPALKGLPSYGRTIPRLTLDGWVLDSARRAGATVIERTKATAVERDADGVTVRAEVDGRPAQWRGALVVGADGSSSLTARTLRGDAPPKDDRIMAVRIYVSGITGPQDQADLYFNGASFPGYYWLFPTGGGNANLGLGMLLSTIPPSTEGLRDLLLRLCASDAALAQRLGGAELTGRVVGWPLTTYNHRLALVHDRAVLVGDAAGLINPLNGEGIQYALQSGRWAATTILDAFAAHDLSAAQLRPYQRQVADELRHDMALAGTIVQLIRNRALTPLWLEALKVIVARAKHDPDYAEVVGGILAGLVPASNAISTDVILATIEQVIMSGFGRAVWAGLGGPRHVVDSATGVAAAGAAMLRESTSDPSGLLRWGYGLITQLGELGTQTAKAMVR